MTTAMWVKQLLKPHIDGGIELSLAGRYRLTTAATEDGLVGVGMLLMPAYMIAEVKEFIAHRFGEADESTRIVDPEEN